MQKAQQVVHESETQRQYIRLQLPASALIDGNRISVKDLSSGGMALRDIDTKAFKKGQKIELILILPFADFTIDLDLKAEIQYIDKKLKVAGCRFIDLKPSQISILNHVLRAFISGDVEKDTDIINVVARDNFANIRKHQDNEETTKAELVKRYSLYALSLLAIILVSSFIIGNIMDKLFVIKTADAQVYVPTINIMAPLSGTYVSALPIGVKTVEKNTPLSKIVSTDSNDTIVIYSPCDCYITQRKILDGQYTAQDNHLFELIDNNEKPMIKAFTTLENAQRLEVGTPATMKIIGLDDGIEGSIHSIQIEKAIAPNQMSRAEVLIIPNIPLSVDLLNRLAFVEFYL